MHRTRKLIVTLGAVTAALMVAAVSQAGSGHDAGRDNKGFGLAQAGLVSSAPEAGFPAGAPTQAGDPTRSGDRKWKEKDAKDRGARRSRTKDCNCWDEYAQGEIELKVLLIGADGNEPAFGDWKSLLTREGVPFTAIVAKDAGPLTAATFSDRAGHALYQAVVLSNDGLYYWNGSAYVSALSPESWAALQAFESQFRIRQVTSVVYPQPQYGLEYPTFAGDFGGETAQLTAAGKQAFPYLAGTVLYDSGAYGYKAKPLAGAAFQPLVQAADGSALVGVNTNPDGRQELVATVAQNQWMTQSQLLGHGVLNWVTRGVRLGMNRNYLSLHVDDAFNGDDRWDTVANVTTADPSTTIVMTPADVDRAVAWQKASGLRLDLAFNGAAAASYPSLAAALIGAKQSFGWINHTYTHLNLNTLDTATISGEIAQNIAFGKANRLPFDRTELVTGEHSGLSNPNLAQALADNGIAFTASDASREAGQRLIGSTLTVPRHPTNVFYNVGTKAEQLDEYNYVYYEACVSGCLAAPATWDQYVANEVAIMFRHVAMNDAYPHYAHVSNLAEDAVLLPVVDALLAKYRSLFTAAIVDPTLSDAGLQVKRQAAWQAALDAGQVSARLSKGKVSVSAPAGLDVPLTGTKKVDQYGAERSGWKTSDGSLQLKVATAGGGED